MDIGKIEYRVRPVTRYHVTRFESSECGRGAGSSSKGEFDSERVAFEVATALCKDEHQRLGWPIGDERIRYPVLEGVSEASASGLLSRIAASHDANTAEVRSLVGEDDGA